MVYGHRHIDHIGGARRFADFVQDKFPKAQLFIWGTTEARDFLARDPESTLPKPSVIVGSRGRTIKLSPSLSLKLTVLGGHTQSDLAAHVLPSRDGPGVMHFVDVFTPGFAPFFDFAIMIDLHRNIAVHKELLDFDFEIVSAGHGRLGTKEDIRVNLEYTLDTISFAKAAAEEIKSQQMQEAGLDRLNDPTAPRYRNEQWALKTMINMQGKVCERKLTRKWGCRLAAVDLCSLTHCKEALFFNLTEKE